MTHLRCALKTRHTIELEGSLLQNHTTISGYHELWWSEAIIGITCHETLAWAHAEDARHLFAFERFFPSVTKPKAKPSAFHKLPTGLLQPDIQVVEINSVSTENGDWLIDESADMLALIRGLFAGLYCQKIKTTT
ncbi:MAG: hypothetical protein CMD92_09695 [Gammaproteobacteria bacterium]|nr:hypothetical protein [Gammaproteobacteria bacterium]